MTEEATNQLYNGAADTDLSFLGGGQKQDGFDGAKAGDFKNSYLIPLQSGSPQVKKEKKEHYIQGAEAGMWYDTVTKKLLGTSIQVVVLKRETVWLEFDPVKDTLVAIHAPDSIPVDKGNFKHWLHGDNEIVETINHYVLLVDALKEGIKILPLKGSALKHARSWFTDMKNLTAPNGDPAHVWAGVWELPLLFNENSEGDWYTIGKDKVCGVKFTRFISSDEFLSQVKSAREFVKSMTQIQASPVPALEAPAASSGSEDY